MLIVQDILISDALISEHFVCNLKACKGACCWEGDYGAPLDPEELHTLAGIYDDIKPFLSPLGQQVIEANGPFTYYEEPKNFGTPLIDNGACAYMTRDQNGTAQCGIEKAYNAGATDFKKPISCHLYPVRINKNQVSGFEALNYDRWDICSAACQLGKRERVPVYRFIKDALLRKYGADFYEELDAAARHLSKK